MAQIPDHYRARIRDFSGRTSSGCYDLLDEKQKQLYLVVRSLGGENGEHLIEKIAVKARCEPFFDLDKTRIHLTDFCYNMINADDNENKFLLRKAVGKFYFVDFDWSCELGETITWKTKELKKRLAVGEYKNRSFQWDFIELEQELE